MYRERLVVPSKGYEDDFYYINSVDWVNVIALTKDSEVVMVEQYRVGVDLITLELPGGILDSKNEDPKQAAQRELLEETGFSGTDFQDLGWVHSNPAMINNRSHSFLVKDVTKIQEPSFDPSETNSYSSGPTR